MSVNITKSIRFDYGENIRYRYGLSLKLLLFTPKSWKTIIPLIVENLERHFCWLIGRKECTNIRHLCNANKNNSP
jgi:hypothetical protein